jgi:hypothetical protein
MGDSAPRKQPPDDRGTGKGREAPAAEPEQEPPAQADPRPAADPAKKQGPQSKFHGGQPGQR